jgi:ribosomal protein S18 acetylase RimI-like enzyme
MNRSAISIFIREETDCDRTALQLIVRRAWQYSYAHIFTAQEMSAFFEGRLPGGGDWLGQRVQTLPGLVAEMDTMITGAASLALLENGDGELAGLFVDPTYQGQGIGSALWLASLERLRECECPAMWVWVLSKAQAVSFYESRGCQIEGSGSYHIGRHREPVRGYRLIL